MKTVHLYVDSSAIQAQVREALNLLESVPERFYRQVADVLLERIATGDLEFRDVAGVSTTVAGEDLVCRPAFGANFENALAALRAGKFDLV